MKAYNKRKRPKNSFKGRYRMIGSGKYRFCKAGDMWVWKSIADFRIREKHIQAFRTSAECMEKTLGEIKVPDWAVFGFNRCIPVIQKEEEC